MDNGAQFFLCDAVADCSAAMKFPLMHLPERADHGEIHHRAGFGVDGFVTPAKAPAPGRHRFLKGTRELVGILEYTIHIFGAERGFPLLKACFKHVVHYSCSSPDRWHCGIASPRYKAENSKVQRQEMVVNIN